MKAAFAGGNHGSLKLQNGLVSQSRSIGEIAGRSSYGGNQTVVRINA